MPQGRAIAAAAALGTVVAAGPAAAADWERAVGRLNLSGFDWQQHCTGTLITRHAILTAAHCVYVHSRQRWAKPAEINFLAGYDRGDFVAHIRAKRIMRAQSFTPTASLSLADMANDWAIIVTAKPAPAAITPIGLRSTLPESPVVAAGYVRGSPHRLSKQGDCRLRADAAPGPWLLAHTCRLGRGASGGPLIARTAAGPRVIGMQTGRSARMGYAVPTATFAPTVAAADARARP